MTFKDQDNVAQNPSSARYRIDDPGNGAAVRGWTALAPVAGGVVIELKPSDHIVADGATRALRKVTIDADYGSDDGVTDEYLYELKGLDYMGAAD